MSKPLPGNPGPDNGALRPGKAPVHPKPVARAKVEGNLETQTGDTAMTSSHSQHRAGQRTRYRIVDHREAGLFESMTGAMIWAIRNLRDSNWRIEPVATPHP
jgi:hypothetical protein